MFSPQDPRHTQKTAEREVTCVEKMVCLVGG